MIIAELSCLMVVVVFLTDEAEWWRIITGTISYIGLKKWKPFPMKPFSCSFCMTWWVCLIYLIATHHFTIPYIAFVCVLAMLTGPTLSLMRAIVDKINRLSNKI